MKLECISWTLRWVQELQVVVYYNRTEGVNAPAYFFRVRSWFMYEHGSPEAWAGRPWKCFLSQTPLSLRISRIFRILRLRKKSDSFGQIHEPNFFPDIWFIVNFGSCKRDATTSPTRSTVMLSFWMLENLGFWVFTFRKVSWGGILSILQANEIAE